MYQLGFLFWQLIALNSLKFVLTEEVLLKTALGGQPFNQFKEASKQCDAACTQYGNCNLDLGTCECPFGLTGPKCEIPMFPACRATTREGIPIFIGRTVPRNCFCYKQLLREMCLPGTDLRCASHTLYSWGALHCFQHAAHPEAQQLSDLPDPLDDPSYRWYKGVLHVQPGPEGYDYKTDMEPLPQLPDADALNGALPLSKCPARCNDRGVCRRMGGSQSQPECICLDGFTGADCGGVATTSGLCPANCQGRGKCVGGLCKCDPPYWGIGCGRRTAYQPVPGSVYHPYYPTLKIYMYDIPISITGPQPFDDGDVNVFPIYQANLRFIEQFLSDVSGVRTENPYEANMFFVPTFAYYTSANLGDPTGPVVRALDWARTTFPFFDRYQGKDHFVILTVDRGACYLKPLNQTQNLIRLVHFGMERPNISDMGPLVKNKEYGCFKGGRDVVLAPFFKPHAQQVKDIHALLEQTDGAKMLLAKKDLLFFFSGDIRHEEPEYSGGVRQVLSKLLANASYPDVVFKGGFQSFVPREYESLLSRSKFCLAPYGHGWGIRLSHALMHGCVPVIIQDKVRQPWEDLLHYPDFSVRIPKAELHRIVNILRAVPEEDLLNLIRENIRVYRAFIWQPELGGLAYNYTITSLRRRLSFIRGELYEAGTRRRKE